jgi:hypothetical protein
MITHEDHNFARLIDDRRDAILFPIGYIPQAGTIVACC